MGDAVERAIDPPCACSEFAISGKVHNLWCARVHSYSSFKGDETAMKKIKLEQLGVLLAATCVFLAPGLSQQHSDDGSSLKHFQITGQCLRCLDRIIKPHSVKCEDVIYEIEEQSDTFEIKVIKKNWKGGAEYVCSKKTGDILSRRTQK